jgi:hypothetical protein
MFVVSFFSCLQCLERCWRVQSQPLPSPSPLLCIIHRSSNFPGWLPLDWRVFIADSLHYSASKYVVVAPAPRVASPGSPVAGTVPRALAGSTTGVWEDGQGRGQLGPDHGMDANDDGSSGDDESASFQLDRWVPGLSGPGGLVWSSGPVGPCRRRFPFGGPWTASVFCHGPLLTLVPSGSDDSDATTSVHQASGLR